MLVVFSNPDMSPFESMISFTAAIAFLLGDLSGMLIKVISCLGIRMHFVCGMFFRLYV